MHCSPKYTKNRMQIRPYTPLLCEINTRHWKINTTTNTCWVVLWQQIVGGAKSLRLFSKKKAVYKCMNQNILLSPHSKWFYICSSIENKFHWNAKKHLNHSCFSKTANNFQSHPFKSPFRSTKQDVHVTTHLTCLTSHISKQPNDYTT